MLDIDIPISGIKSIPSNGKTMLAEVTIHKFDKQIFKIKLIYKNNQIGFPAKDDSLMTT